MNPPNGIKAVFFDLDNTLVDRSSAIKKYFSILLRRAPRSYTGNVQTNLDAILQQDNLGYADRSEFCQWVVSRFLPQWSADELWNDFSKKMPQHILPYSHHQTFLKQLKEQYQLVIVSNGSSRNQRAKIQAAELEPFFDHIVISEEIGVEKPNPDIFRKALESLAIESNQTLYVGDHPENDVVCPSNAGMKTCWITLGREYPPILSQPHYQIPSIDSLPSLFPCLTPVNV